METFFLPLSHPSYSLFPLRFGTPLKNFRAPLEERELGRKGGSEEGGTLMRRSESFSTAPYESGYRFLLTNVFPSHQPVEKKGILRSSEWLQQIPFIFSTGVSSPLASSNENMLQGGKKKRVRKKTRREGGRGKSGEGGWRGVNSH